MEVRNIIYGSPEYDEAFHLRDLVLRKPLGMVLNRADVAREVNDIHVGVFSNEKLVAYALMRPEQPIAWMKQVAVDPSVQGKGLGRILIQGFETRALEEGFKEIHLHARESAIPFYKKLDYHITGEPFEEVGIPHQCMWKQLQA